jgi:hypothetical protein
LEDVGKDGKIILEHIYAGRVLNDSTEYDAVAGSFEYGIDHSCSIKCGYFPDQLSDC